MERKSHQSNEYIGKANLPYVLRFLNFLRFTNTVEKLIGARKKKKKKNV